MAIQLLASIVLPQSLRFQLSSFYNMLIRESFDCRSVQSNREIKKKVEVKQLIYTYVLGKEMYFVDWHADGSDIEN